MIEQREACKVIAKLFGNKEVVDAVNGFFTELGKEVHCYSNNDDEYVHRCIADWWVFK